MKCLILRIRRQPLPAMLTFAAVLLLTTTAHVRPQGGSGWSTTAINVTEFSFTPSTIDVTNSPQTITATLRVTDTERDFRFGHITFRSPVIGHQYGFGPEDRISGNARDGVYRKEFVFPQYSQRGTWEVSSIFVYDGTPDYYRWRDLNSDYLAARGFPTQFQATNNNEAILPEISDFSFTPPAVDTRHHARNVEITLRARDDSGVGRMSVGFLNPPDCYVYDEENCAGVWFSIEDRHRVSGDDNDGVYRTVVQIPRQFPLGTYSASVDAFDGVNNRRRLNSADLALLGYSSQLRNFRIAPFDFGDDGRSDISVWRPSNGTWFIRQNPGGFRAVNWGVETDKLTPADYDGDGRSDLAVFRPATGHWFVFNSADQSFQTFEWGAEGDVPIPADHDGDGRADFVLFRPTAGTWYTRFSDGKFSTKEFGVAGDQPVIGDFDGDGNSDIAVYRPSDYKWYLQRTRLGFFIQSWGEAADIPVPADYDGDGKTDIAVWRPSTGQWYLIQSTAGLAVVTWGQSGDQPIPADYDGDGKTDVAVFRPASAAWYIIGSTSGINQQAFGQTGDLPTQSAFIY